jgi:hypothetical protein
VPAQNSHYSHHYVPSHPRHQSAAAQVHGGAQSQHGAVHSVHPVHQQPGSGNFVAKAQNTGASNVPVMSAPPSGSTPVTPIYDFYIDGAGQTCRVLRSTQQVTQYRTEYHCSPTSGRLYTKQVPVATGPSPARSKLEWRCNPETGERYQVEVPISQLSPQPANQVQYPPAAMLGHASQPLPSMMHNTPQPGTTPMPPPASLPTTHHPHGVGSLDQQQHLQPGPGGSFSQQLQDKMKGIVRLVEGGVTKVTNKPMDYAKKCPARWAKKTTSESINLPLFTYGSICELESSLSGRSAPLTQGDLLAKIRHIRNYLEVCCLNSEPTDFKGYGWTIAKDYASKVESGVDQQLTSWGEMSGGVQTDQLVLAQMDFPRPLPFQKKSGSGREPDPKSSSTTARERCKTYNSCKTEDKCEYELSHPDKKCILKHECGWCKVHLKQSYKHQEWACKKKN